MRPYTPFALTAALFAPASAFAEAEPAQESVQEPAEQEQEQASEFEIIMESPQPEGWPEPGPAFEITLKHYPAYRAAVKEGRNGFWPLFRHISDRNIPMTAPVEMDMEASDGRYQMTNMAFLYQSLEVGETGEVENGVEVIDYPALTVLSFGSNGNYNQRKIDDILEQIDAHLETISDEWQATGEMRVMGYNSPMIRAERRYFEVQVVIEPVETSEDETQHTASEEDTAAD
ncbi:MAG: heme-binding protein [Planctomycetota bacterium]